MKEESDEVVYPTTNYSVMTHRPTIFIHDSKSYRDASNSLSDDVMCSWPNGLPPTFVSEVRNADVAILLADGYSQLLELLPTLLELQSSQTPTVLCCDDYGDLYDLVTEFGTFTLALDASPSLIAGVLFGIVNRNGQVSKLRSKVGLIQSMHSTLQDDLSLLQDDLKSAAAVQREFMSTELHDVHGITFSSLWRPASIVSGDMYDITQLDDEHVAIFIADAIGHGIAAAMLAMMVTRTLSANRFNPNTGQFTQPRELLQTLNSALFEHRGDNTRFATAAYGILNCKTRTFTYAGAGHPPTLLNRNSQKPILLHSEGPLLGVFEKDEFPQQTVEISTGDTVLMYSDGFEFALAQNNAESKELPAYLQSLHEFCKQNDTNILEKITSHLDRTSPAFAEDDLTMICMQATSAESSIRLAA